MRLPVEQFLPVWYHEVHRVLRFVLRYGCAGRHLVAMTDVADLEGHKVAVAELAVDAKVEQGKLANTALHLRRVRNAQMSLSLNGAFWATILPLFYGTR